MKRDAESAGLANAERLRLESMNCDCVVTGGPIVGSLEKEFSSCFHLCIADVVLRLKQNWDSLNRQLRTLIFFLKKVFVGK